MDRFFVGMILIVAMWLILPMFGIESRSIIYIIEWATKFVLPWVMLYWIIRFVKNAEKSE